MGNAKTTSLHDKLPVELRQQVERDLVEQPPGRASYQEVFEHYGLADKGISFSALCRYGGYLRELARNQWIRELGDHVAGVDLAPRIQATVRSKLYEALVTGDTKIGDLLKAAITEKAMVDAEVKAETWEAKRQQMEAELERVARTAEHKGHGLTPEVLAEIKSKVLGI